MAWDVIERYKSITLREMVGEKSSDTLKAMQHAQRQGYGLYTLSYLCKLLEPGTA